MPNAIPSLIQWPNAGKPGYCAFGVALIMLSWNAAHAQELQDHWWHVNGEVTKMAIDSANDVLYLAGDFDHIGPVQIYGGIVDQISGALDPGSPVFDINPTMGGELYAVISDGEGGWYVSGEFEEVDGVPRTGIARINADGSLHPWNPIVAGSVDAMVRDGNVLYIGGWFTSINGQPRSGLGAMNTIDGAELPWAPEVVGANHADLAIHGGRLYVCGNFVSIDGQPRNNLAAFELSSGMLLPWSPDVDGMTMGIAGHGDAVYVRGYFNNLGGLPRNRVGALDTLSGAALPWDPQLQAPTMPGTTNLAVEDLKIAGSTLYIGGAFSAASGQIRHGLAAYDLLSGSLSAWTSEVSGGVFELDVQGDTVWVAGNFNEIGGTYRTHLAALHTFTADVLGPLVPASGPIHYISVSGTQLFVGYNSQSIGGGMRNGLASLDINTGEATDWAPEVDGAIYAMTAVGGVVYLGGLFTTVNGEPRANFAAVDGSSGTLLPLQPVINNAVYALMVSGNDIFIGGYFTHVNGTPRTAIAKMDIPTGNVSTWDPQVLWGNVRAIGLRGNTLFFGGLFLEVGGMPRSRVAAVDATTGQLDAWAPQVFYGGVLDLDVNEQEIMTSGAFQTVDSVFHPHVAVFHPVTGDLHPFAVDLFTLDGPAYASAGVNHWGKRYIGGEFWQAEGQSRVGFAAYDASTGDLDPWTPGLWYQAVVPTVHAIGTRNDLLILVGSFFMAGNKLRTGIVGFRLPDCSGLIGGSAVPGTPCDDGDPATVNDAWTNACICAGELSVSTATMPGTDPLRWSYLPDGNIQLDRSMGVTLYDAVGKQVAYSGATQHIALDGLRPGTYVVRTDEGQVFRVLGGVGRP
jgi:hypothetical protein